MPRFPDDLIGSADILTSALDDSGEVRLNLGDALTGEGISNDSSYWGIDGFVSRPNDATSTGAAQALYMVDGHQKRVLASRDNRWITGYGQLAAGDRAIVSDCEAKFLLKKDRSAVTLYTTNEQDDNNSMMVDVDGKNGIITIINAGSVLRMTKDEIVLAVSGGNASITLNGDGAVQITGKSFWAATSGVCLGTVGGAPPIPGVMSALIGPVGLAGVPSTSVVIAP